MLLIMNTVIKYLEKPNAQEVWLKIGTRVSLQSGPLLAVWCWLLHITHTLSLYYCLVRHELIQQGRQKPCCVHIYCWNGAKWLVCVKVIIFIRDWEQIQFFHTEILSQILPDNCYIAMLQPVSLWSWRYFQKMLYSI